LTPSDRRARSPLLRSVMRWNSAGDLGHSVCVAPSYLLSVGAPGKAKGGSSEEDPPFTGPGARCLSQWPHVELLGDGEWDVHRNSRPPWRRPGKRIGSRQRSTGWLGPISLVPSRATTRFSSRLRTGTLSGEWCGRCDGSGEGADEAPGPLRPPALGTCMGYCPRMWNISEVSGAIV
jgi:hypothetical protein